MKNLFCLFLMFICFRVSAQEIKYLRKDNISYYERSTTQDDYMRSQCRLDIYYPENKKDFATIVWFHGGGITGGSKEIPKALTEKGYAVVGVGYRFSPKVKAPAYIEDAAAAIAWVFKNIQSFGGSEELIFVSGHSAGGYLGAMVALDKSYLAAFGLDADRIAATIPFSGHTITHFTIRQENGIEGTQPTIDRYAPLFHVRKDAPPLHLITGGAELEMLGRYEENAYMWRMMKVAGHEDSYLYKLDGFDHGAMAEPAFPLLLRIVRERSAEILKE